jgi:hypothetical protein
MADQAQFEALMRALMSEKNEERKAAEAQFEGLVRTPPQAAPLMCTAMVTSADLTVRSMTTIMFRKRVDEAFYKALPPDMQASGPSPLLAKAECHDNLIQNNLIQHLLLLLRLSIQCIGFYWNFPYENVYYKHTVTRGVYWKHT